MGRNSIRELVYKVANALEWQPKSIAEISREIDADRKAVTAYLEALTNADNIKEYETEGRARKFGKARTCGRCRHEVEQE